MGNIVTMPEKLITVASNVGTTFILLWKKSPRLTLTMVAVMLVTQRLKIWLNQLQSALSGALGLDTSMQSSLWLEEWGIQEALGEFEDMRVNAKEPDLMEAIQKCTAEKELQQLRKSVVPSFLQPVTLLLNQAPTIICCYFGGRLALGGNISSSDLTNFSYQVSHVVWALDV